MKISTYKSGSLHQISCSGFGTERKALLTLRGRLWAVRGRMEDTAGLYTIRLSDKNLRRSAALDRAHYFVEYGI